MSRTLFLYAIAAIAVGPTAVAQSINAMPGQISQLPPAPQSARPAENFRLERRPPPRVDSSSGPAVTVAILRIQGQTRFGEATLVGVTGFRPGATLTLGDLRNMAGLITAYYSRHGYVVAQAYVPAQEMSGGAVTLVVVEGRYDAVSLRNRSRLQDPVARATLSGLRHGDVVEAAPLERRLLLLSDVPGVAVSGTLSPGATVGGSDLQVDVANTPLISGEVDADNGGNPYTGRYRGGGAVYLNDPLGLGDQLSVRALTSGNGLFYVRGAYQAQLGLATVGVAYADMHYHLGRQFAVLDARGDEQVASAYASYPLVRSYDDTLRALADFDHRTFQDRIGAPATETDKRAEVVSFGLAGDHHDGFGGGGWDVYSLFGVGGDLDIETAAARAADTATARTQGGYGKVSFSIDRLQNLPGPFQLYGLVRGQAASKNLDISEKMELGGAYGVRSYPEGESYGDEGYIATAELRLWLPTPWQALPGRLQLAVFGDTGQVRYSVHPFVPGPNSVTRSGVGAGLTWSRSGDFLARVSYALRVGTSRATSSPDHGGELWFQVVKFF